MRNIAFLVPFALISHLAQAQVDRPSYLDPSHNHDWMNNGEDNTRTTVDSGPRLDGYRDNSIPERDSGQDAGLCVFSGRGCGR